MVSLMNLAQMVPGQSGKIVELTADDRVIHRKLMSLGIIPGISLLLLRVHPGMVIQVGHTKVALDYTYARFIYVQSG